jgi:hypothetical protein
MKKRLLSALIVSGILLPTALAGPVVIGTPPAIDRPISSLPDPSRKLPRSILGDLVVRKAESRVYPGSLVGLASPKVQLQVSFCAKNAGISEVPGPLRAKFYWDGVGPFSASPTYPGIQGSLFEQSAVALAGGAEWCGVIKLNFESAAHLQQIGVLKKNPTVGVWAKGKNESANNNNAISNNTKAVTHIGAF